MNSVRNWFFSMGWVTSWVGNWLAIASASALSCPFTSGKQVTFWVKGYVGRLVSLYLQYEFCLSTGDGQLLASYPPLGVSARIILTDSIEPSSSQDYGTF